MPQPALSRRTPPRLAAPGQNAADLLQFYVFSSFF